MQPHGRVDLPLTVRRVVEGCYKLSWAQKAVWLHDYWLDQGAEGAFISAAKLGRRLGMSASTVEQYRRALVRCGLHESVRRERKRGASWYAVIPSHVVPTSADPTDEEIEALSADLDRWIEIRTGGKSATSNAMRRRDTKRPDLFDRSPTQACGGAECDTPINPPRPPHKSDSDTHINPGRYPHKSPPDTHIKPGGIIRRDRDVRRRDGESGTDGVTLAHASLSGYEVTLPSHRERAASVAHATGETRGGHATPDGDQDLSPQEFERYWNRRLDRGDS